MTQILDRENRIRMKAAWYIHQMVASHHSFSVNCCCGAALKEGRGMAKSWLRSVSDSSW